MNFQQQNHNMNNFEERLQAEVKSREGISNEIMNIRSQVQVQISLFAGLKE